MTAEIVVEVSSSITPDSVDCMETLSFVKLMDTASKVPSAIPATPPVEDVGR